MCEPLSNYNIMSYQEIIGRMCEPLLATTPPYILLSFSLALLAYTLGITNKDDDITLTNLNSRIIDRRYFVIKYRYLLRFGRIMIFGLIMSCLIKIIIKPYDIDMLIKLFLIMTIIPLVITYFFMRSINRERELLFTVKSIETDYKQKNEERKLQIMLDIHKSINDLNKNPGS